MNTAHDERAAMDLSGHARQRTVIIPRRFSRWTGAAVLTMFLIGIAEAYWPLMMGQHLTGDLDPNQAVNAWGGPSYLGAVLAHWLDGIVIFYAVGLLLNWVLLPSAAPKVSQREDPDGARQRGTVA